MTVEASFAEAVAARAGCATAEAIDVLHDFQITTTGAPATPHRLRVTRLKFSGEKSGVDDGPFEFDQKFGDGLWALVSQRNDAGKTSVFEVMMWALRGAPRGELQTDVRAWLRRVELEGLVDEIPFRVEFDVENGIATGVLQSDSDQTGFTTGDGFSDAMSSFMLERLGLATFTNWVRERGSQTHGWPSYTGGLYLSRNSLNVVLGEHVQGGLPGRLLLMFVGVPWAQAQTAAQTARREVAERSRRSVDADDTIRQRAAAELDVLAERRDDARARLASTPDVAAVLVDLDTAADQWAALASASAALQQELAEADRHAKEATSAVAAELKRLTDMNEAKIAHRLFHGMDPTQCPRCSAPIEADRRNAELQQGHCSVCTRDVVGDDEVLVDAMDSEETDDDEVEDVQTLQLLIAHLEEEAEAASNRVGALREELIQSTSQREQAQHHLAELRLAAGGMGENRALELEVAALDARVEQLGSIVDTPSTPEDNELDLAEILKAAEEEARDRLAEDFDGILEDLAREVLDLGQRFGIDSLQSIEINRATHIKVGKGGAITSFSHCTPGERLRLRIAMVIALLRVAEAHGVGRHPGLLLIDSIGAEETEAGNLAEFMKQLAEVTDALGIETIVASARSEILSFIPEEHALVAQGDQYLW